MGTHPPDTRLLDQTPPNLYTQSRCSPSSPSSPLRLSRLSTPPPSAASEVSSAVESATGTASSVAPVATGTTGNESYPLYPCPTGFLLTYVEQNVTVDVPITQVGQAIGNWSDSPIFPNVTDAMGGTTVGATHTLNLAGGIALPEVLVNATTNSTSGYAMWNWNYTAAPSPPATSASPTTPPSSRSSTQTSPPPR